MVCVLSRAAVAPEVPVKPKKAAVNAIQQATPVHRDDGHAETVEDDDGGYDDDDFEVCTSSLSIFRCGVQWIPS